MIYLYLEIDPATSSNVFTLMGDAFGCFTVALEKGRFKLPEPGTAVWELSHNEMQWLFSGINFMKQKVKKFDSQIEYLILEKIMTAVASHDSIALQLKDCECLLNAH